MTASADDMSGPTSRIFFSQRLRLHYVDWGNPARAAAAAGAWRARSLPQLGLGRRARCAMTGTSSRPICAAMATANGRPTAITAWPAIIYDLAQLVHQQQLAPVTIIAHSLGGNIALRYAGIYPDKVAKLVAIEGMGPSPRMLAERLQAEPIAERMQQLDRRAARARPAACRGATPRSRRRSSACRRRTSTSRPSRRGI